MDSHHAEFLQLFLRDQQVLYAYLRSAGFSMSDADDVLQDTGLVLWERFSTYDRSKPFRAWAFGIVKNLIFRQLRYAKVRSKVLVDSRICEEIANCAEETLSEMGDEFELERERLELCLDRLPKHSRSLLQLRYVKSLSLEQIAKLQGKTYEAMNMILSRLRSKLFECLGGKRKEVLS